MKPFFAFLHAVSAASVPTVIFHGLNDNCNNNEILTQVIQNNTGAPAFCIEVGNGVQTTWRTTINNQAQEACQKIIDDPLLGKAPEINAIGFS